MNQTLDILSLVFSFLKPKGKEFISLWRLMDPGIRRLPAAKSVRQPMILSSKRSRNHSFGRLLGFNRPATLTSKDMIVPVKKKRRSAVSLCFAGAFFYLWWQLANRRKRICQRGMIGCPRMPPRVNPIINVLFLSSNTYDFQ